MNRPFEDRTKPKGDRGSSPLLVVKNIGREGPGLIGEALDGRGLAYHLVDLERDDALPSPKNYRALVVLGGPDSANDDTAKMRAELELIRECLALEIPFLGVCLGMQALAKAAGGSVVRNAVKEVGFRDADGNLFEVILTDEGVIDPLFQGLSNRLGAFQLHGEAVVPAEGISILATGRFCATQAVRVGNNAYGLQFHLELTADLLDEWARCDDDLSKIDRDALYKDFDLTREEQAQAGRRLFNNFIDLVAQRLDDPTER